MRHDLYLDRTVCTACPRRGCSAAMFWYAAAGMLYSCTYLYSKHHHHSNHVWRLDLNPCRTHSTFLLTRTVRQSTTLSYPHQNSLMAARAIPLSACRLGPPSDNGTRKWNGLNAQHFIQSTSVDSCRQHKMWKCESAVKAWKQKRSAYYDICIT